MRPSVRTNLMSGGVGVLDTRDGIVAVDAVVVVAIEEKGSFSTSVGNLIRNLFEILEWT